MNFLTLSARERSQIAISHHHDVTLDDMVHFNDEIKQEVASAGFDLSVPIKTGNSDKYTSYRCRMCAVMRRPQQFWRHFFTTSRPTDRCPETQGGDKRE